MSTNSLWIILIGSLVAGGCGVIGCFLVLRRLSMLGDAISHAVLPGIVVAFLITRSLASVPVFLGAILVGILTAFLVQWLARGGVQGDAAIGVVFTSLFAIGVVMVSHPEVSKTHLDVECVLYGEIALAPYDRLRFAGYVLGPRAAWVSGGLLLFNLTLIGLFFKQFKICAFDPEMAAAVGINVGAMHYLLMSMVSVTTVGAFESVGAILVVAMLIVPGATAYLLTDRLERMLAISFGVGALASAGGYMMARALDASIAGSMATVGGMLFLAAFLFSPSHGVVVRRMTQARLRRRVADEDVLLWAGRRLETDAAAGFTGQELSRGLEWLPGEAMHVLDRLMRRGLLSRHSAAFELTVSGKNEATELLRRHRLYETYLGDLGYAQDHLHAPADRVEHHLSPALTAAVDAAAHHPDYDPQGKRIPPRYE